jgi:predicted membrane protein
MTTLEDQFQNDNKFQEWERNHRKGRVIGGIALITAGVLFWFEKAGVFDFPSWVFSWQMLLIVIGIISGIKHNFKNSAWFILIAIGTIFLIADFIPALPIRFYTVPIVLIIIGVVFILKPKNKYHYYQRYKYRHGKWNNEHESGAFNTTDEYLSINNVFGGVKKNVITKNFKGGEINNTFGGCEVNLMQADIENEAVIDLNSTFGGIRLVIPAHWQLKSDVTTVMGGLEDKRPMANPNMINEQKTLILKGNVFFGGIDIKSY